MKQKYIQEFLNFILYIIFLNCLLAIYIIMIVFCVTNDNILAIIFLSIIGLFPFIYLLKSIIKYKNKYLYFDYEKLEFYHKDNIYKTIIWQDVKNAELVYEYRNWYIELHISDNVERILYRKSIEKALKYYGKISIKKEQ